MDEQLEIVEKKEEGLVNVYLTGEVDIYTSQQLKDKLYNLLDSERNDIRINCAGMNYIDSTGLGIMVGALKKAKEHGNMIYISNLKKNIKKLFAITGLDKVFIIE